MDTDGNNPVTIPVLANDQPTTGFSLIPSSVQVVSGPARGTTAVDPASGDITYTAVGFFMGTDTFQYTARDTSGAVSAPTEVTVVIHRPTANDDFATTPAGTPVTVDVLANDTDPDGNNQISPASVAVTTQPAHGSVAVDPATGQTTYTPAAGFVGTDSWRYTVTDLPGAVSSPATVSVVVTSPPVAPPVPTAVDDIADTDGNNSVTVDVLANDVPVPGHPLQPGTVQVVTAPARGSVSVNPTTGAVTYTATGFFMGTDTFRYAVSDGTGVSNAATVTIVIHRPTANDDLADTDGNNPVTVDVLANDTDPDGNNQINPASVAVTTQPAHGSVAVDPTTGAITYTATGTFEGTDTFQYTVTDLPGAVSSPATVTIVIHRPTANDDTALTLGAAPVVIPVLANDTDPDGNDKLNATSVAVVSGPAHGSVSVDPATGSVTYTPDGDFVGTDSFTYTVTDFPGAVSSPGTVRVKVEPAPAALFTAVGADSGGAPRVVLLNPDGSVRASFFAYDPSFTGGVRVAVGDVNGDGTPDIITAPGSGGGPNVRVFSGTDLQLIASFFAYDPSFRGGVTVAAGDVTGDGRADVVTGAGAGGGPQVNVFNGATGDLVRPFFAYDPSFRGGVSVAVADTDGDGRADVVTGAGIGGAPQVNVFSGADLSLIRSIFAFDASFRGGVSVAAGDTNGDTLADVIAAAGPGGGPAVAVFDGPTGALRQTFFAYDRSFRGGVRVAAADLNQDGRADLVIGPGSGQQLSILTLDGQTLARLQTDDALGAFLGGVYVGGPG
jgi:hypothetical protein